MTDLDNLEEKLSLAIMALPWDLLTRPYGNSPELLLARDEIEVCLKRGGLSDELRGDLEAVLANVPAEEVLLNLPDLLSDDEKRLLISSVVEAFKTVCKENREDEE